MNIQTINAEQKLISLTSSISHAPLSWVGWSCIYLDLFATEQDMKPECLLWVKSVIASYFADIETHVYVCNNEDVHIICKTTSLDIIHQAAQQIFDMAHDESQVNICYHIYNLTRDAQGYAQTVLDKAGHTHPHNQIGINDMSGMLNVFQQSETQKPKNPSEQVKVLLVEDDPVARWMVRNALKQNCEFVTAPTANKAFAMYGSYQPDIVFLDIGLPDKSGHEVLKWIIRNDPGACVVMFSSNDNLENIARALEGGAAGFVPKPFLKESLLHYINNHVG